MNKNEKYGLRNESRQVNPESGEMFSELEISIGSSYEDSDSLNTECREGDSYRCDNHSEETSCNHEEGSRDCEEDFDVYFEKFRNSEKDPWGCYDVPYVDSEGHEIFFCVMDDDEDELPFEDACDDDELPFEDSYYDDELPFGDSSDDYELPFEDSLDDDELPFEDSYYDDELSPADDGYHDEISYRSRAQVDDMWANPESRSREKQAYLRENTTKAQMESGWRQGWKEIGADRLDNDEREAFSLLVWQFLERFTQPFCFDKAKTQGEPDHNIAHNLRPQQLGKLRGKMGSLIEKGLVVKTDDNGYLIAPHVAEALFHGLDSVVNYEKISTMACVVKPGNIAKKELFFGEGAREEIGHLRKLLSPKGFEHACKVLKGRKRAPGIHSLLWGGPGTGKTETVRQLALESGRDLFQFEVSKVTGGEWGATEKHYRALFQEYRYIVAVKSLAPILFINEADQVLSRRLTRIERAIDKSENTVSNILLEEFENLHGILLATTNFADLLDQAFDRRFLFKTELQKPGQEAQAKIWKSSIPELSMEECVYLAQLYNLSGAQISNVCTKRELAELYEEGERGLSFIEDLCRKELKGEQTASARPARIGFAI